jgi:hypothetical protein
MSRPRSDGCGGDFLGVPKHEADHPDIARNLEPKNGKTDHIEWDDEFPGFGVRLRVGRNRVSRMWIYQYDIAGRPRPLGNPWPDDVRPDFSGIDIGIARTCAAYEDTNEIREVEALFLDTIDCAERTIYIENQFLAHGVSSCGNQCRDAT